jgi:hypothetical protein
MIACLVVAACATGGPSNEALKQDASTNEPKDAPNVNHDAIPPIDSSTPIDAFVPPDAPPDAASGGFCQDNTQCLAPGECCFVLACVAGTAVGNTLCFPS